MKHVKSNKINPGIQGKKVNLRGCLAEEGSNQKNLKKKKRKMMERISNLGLGGHPQRFIP